MTGFDGYMNAYLERRIKDIIEEWDLGTKKDFGDFPDRLRAVETEIQNMDQFTEKANMKLTDMEQRLDAVREARQ